MRQVNDTMYVTRAERFTLDLDLRGAKGHPLTLHTSWRNPFLLINFASSVEPNDDSDSHSYWLDLSRVYYEDTTGEAEQTAVAIKKFLSTEALQINEFYDENVVASIVAEGYDFITSSNVGDYLFYFDPLGDGECEYKFYDVDGWVDYYFRFLKEVDTKNFASGTYHYNIFLVCGDTLLDLVKNALIDEGQDDPTVTWENVSTKVEEIQNESKREELKALIASGRPFSHDYDLAMCLVSNKDLVVYPNLKGDMF